jgi:DNA-binding response OmpR family regulator
VDAAEETRDVLQTALERLGLKTLTASRANEGLVMAQEHRPELVVLDLEIEDGKSGEVAARFAEQLPAEQTSLVLLGSVRRQSPPVGEFVAKPYHYAPLIRRIEEILTGREPSSCRRYLSSAETTKVRALT